MTNDEMIAGLPGERLVRAGLADLAAGRRTTAAAIVSIARTRLARAGLLSEGDRCDDAERELYRLLRAEGGDAYGRYNALLRELTSFENALDRRVRRR